MKKTLPVLIGLAALFTLLGCDNGNNNNDPVTEEIKNFNYSDWMSPIADAMPLRNLLIPGAHDAATYRNDVLAPASLKCQNTDFDQQLNQGIRFFDLRVGIKSSDGEVGFYHGSEFLGYLHVDLPDFLTIAANFLGSHEKESLIITLKQEHDGNSDLLPGKINSLIALYPSLFYSGGKKMAELTLGDVRGKIILWDRSFGDESNESKLFYGEYIYMDSSTMYPIPGHNFRVQDLYNPAPSAGTNNDQKMKELTKLKSTAIEACFEDAVKPENSAIMYANFFNISGFLSNWSTAQHILDAVWEQWFTRPDARGIIPMDFYNGGELEYSSSTGVQRQYVYQMIHANYQK
ncbi:phosphatidylinositol-specific phospholipase C [Spirochaetia bacterium]|nr:phosphatidylinositol-specific phospholipase C [Spirochaetia bacterium]